MVDRSGIVADLGLMLVCASSHLPEVASVSAEVNDIIAGGASDSAAFQENVMNYSRPDGSHEVTAIGSSPSRVYADWDRLRDEV